MNRGQWLIQVKRTDRKHAWRILQIPPMEGPVFPAPWVHDAYLKLS